MVSAFGGILSGPFANFLSLSSKIGGDVATQADMVKAAFEAQRQYLQVAAKAKQPSQGDLPMLLKPTSDKISEIQAFREKNRRSNFFNHLSAISESIPALGWVAVVSNFNTTLILLEFYCKFQKITLQNWIQWEINASSIAFKM